MRKPVARKTCEWCMERPVKHGLSKHCEICNPDDRNLQKHPQYRAFMAIFGMKARIYKDACVAFLEAIVATSDEEWAYAMQEHPDKMKRLEQLNTERAKAYNRNGKDVA